MLLERDSNSAPSIVHRGPMSVDYDLEGQDSVIIALKQWNNLPPALRKNQLSSTRFLLVAKRTYASI